MPTRAQFRTRPVRIVVVVIGAIAGLLVLAVVPTRGVHPLSVLGCWGFSLFPIAAAVLAVHGSARWFVSGTASAFVWASAALGFAAGTIGTMCWGYATYREPAPGAPGFSTSAIAFVALPIASLVVGGGGAILGAIAGAVARLSRKGPA